MKTFPYLAYWTALAMILAMGSIACGDDDDDGPANDDDDAPPACESDPCGCETDPVTGDEVVAECCVLTHEDCGDGQRLVDAESPECACEDFEGLNAEAREELLATGLDRYFGAAEPAEEEDLGGGQTAYWFDPADGPVCIWGEPFAASVRPGTANNIIIYLEGGGACWSSLMGCKTDPTVGVPGIGALTPNEPGEDPINPLGDWPVVFATYCDGSVFSGDNELIHEDGELRRHRGLANISATLDLAEKLYPHPDKVLLMGTSAGGFGTLLGAAVTRLKFPKADLYVINDAGPGVQNLERTQDVEERMTEWNVEQFIPDSCEKCDRGRDHLTYIIDWELANDANMKVGMFSAYMDAVIGDGFLRLAGPDFKELLVSVTDEVQDAHPDRFKRYFIPGAQHTGLLLSYYASEIDGELLVDWTDNLINDSPEWADRLAPDDQ